MDWLWLEPQSKRGANNLFLHGINTQLLLHLAGGPSWQACAQIMRRGISQPLPKTTYDLPWYLPSAQLPGKPNHKLSCLHEPGRMYWGGRFCSNSSKSHFLLYRRRWKTEFMPELDYSYAALKHHTSHLKAPGVGGTDHVTIPKQLSNLFCFNCRGLITAVQVLTAWGNQHIYLPKTIRSYSPEEAVNMPAYLQWLPKLCCLRALLLAMAKP